MRLSFLFQLFTLWKKAVGFHKSMIILCYFCTMNELVRHIELLLLENDCVVIPNFGAFIAHYTPARWDSKEKLFFPPMRTIGFNPDIKINDGILVQSFMDAYGTDFSDALKRVNKSVDTLIRVIDEEGKAVLRHIGEMSVTIDSAYTFIPYHEEITSPAFYGTTPFEICDIRQMDSSLYGNQPASTPPKRQTAHHHIIRLDHRIARNAVAIVAIILLFFNLSSPVENTYVETSNYAQLMPVDLFDKIGKQSLLFSPILRTSPEIVKEEKPEITVYADNEVVPQTIPIATKEAVAPESDTQAIPANVPFHIIVASVKSEDEAEKVIDNITQTSSYTPVILKENGKIRVSLTSFDSRNKANDFLKILREASIYKDAWLLTRKK